MSSSWLLTVGLQHSQEGNIALFLLLYLWLKVMSIYYICTRSWCWVRGLHLWLCIRIFYSSAQLLSATYLPCHLFSCKNIMVTEAVGTTLWACPASLWGSELLCLGPVGNPKKTAGMQAGICPSLSATHQNRWEQRVSVWCLGTSFLHLPGKAERTTPALFSPGESENYSLQRCASQSAFILAWLKWAHHNIGEKGSLNHFASTIGQVSSPWASEHIPSAAGADRDFWHMARRGHLSLCSQQDCLVPSLSSQRHP